MAQKIEIDFTDEQISASSGSIFLSGHAKHLRLKERIARDICLKQRKRGSSEADTLLSLIYSLAQGDGHLCDVDRLGADNDVTFNVDNIIHFPMWYYLPIFCLLAGIFIYMMAYIIAKELITPKNQDSCDSYNN